MTARNDLIAYLTSVDRVNSKVVDRYLEVFTRELAVKIRAIRITPSGHPSYDDGKDAGLDLAADTIDPEVQ